MWLISTYVYLIADIWRGLYLFQFSWLISSADIWDTSVDNNLQEAWLISILQIIYDMHCGYISCRNLD